MIARLSTPNGSLQSVTKMVFNPQVNELLALSLDKRVTYWSVNDKKMTK
jgi:WD40 repeat protein